MPGYSITISPIHLKIPLVELHVEKAMSDDLGLVGILGAGSLQTTDSLGNVLDFTLFEIGGQARWYPRKAFEGLHLGGEVVYIYVNASSETTTVEATGAGTSLGAFGGWKWMADIGFSFVVQLGYQAAGIGAEATDEASGQQAEKSSFDTAPLLNLDLGWSF